MYNVCRRRLGSDPINNVVPSGKNPIVSFAPFKCTTLAHCKKPSQVLIMVWESPGCLAWHRVWITFGPFITMFPTPLRLSCTNSSHVFKVFPGFWQGELLFWSKPQFQCHLWKHFWTHCSYDVTIAPSMALQSIVQIFLFISHRIICCIWFHFGGGLWFVTLSF